MTRRLIIQGAASFGKSESMLTILRHELSEPKGLARLHADIDADLSARADAKAGRRLTAYRELCVARMVQRIAVEDMARCALRLAYRGLPWTPLTPTTSI